LTFATFDHPKACSRILLEVLGVDKPSPIALLGKQTLTFEGLEEKNYDI